MPPGRLVVVIATGAATENVRLRETLGPLEPVTWTLNVEEPAVVGHPEIVPELDKVMPAGRLPDLIDHVYGARLPITAKVSL